MMDKLILNLRVAVLSLLFFSQLFLAVNTFLILWVTGKKKAIKRAYTTKGVWVLVSAIFKNFGNFAYLFAVSLMLVSLVVPFRQMASFVAVVIGGALFKEKKILQKSIACLVMIIGVVLIII